MQKRTEDTSVKSQILPIVGDAYQEFSLNLDAQTLVNWFPIVDKNGKFPVALYPFPGLDIFSAQIGDQKSVRGLYEKNNSLYGVIDNKFYRISRTGARDELGTLNTSIGRVMMIDNGYQIMITDGTYGYIYQYRVSPISSELTNTFTVIPNTGDSEAFIPPEILVYLDGYGLYPVRGTFQFFWTDPYHFEKISALNYNTSGEDAQDIVTMIVVHQELWIFNRATTDLFYDTGETDTTFRPRQGLTIEYGCAAAHSVVKTQDNAVIWLALNKYGDSLIVKAEGYTASVISTPAITGIIQSYDTIDDAWAFSFQYRAQFFYVITFPSEDVTWAYNLNTGMWNNWSSTLVTPTPTGNAVRQGRFRGNAYAFIDGLHVVGDFESGNLYYLREDLHTENGQPIVRERTMQHIQDRLLRTSIYMLQIDVESGGGETDDHNYDPAIMLQYSKDGGHTWSSEMWRTCGKIGEYRRRAIWSSLGQAYNWTFRVRVSDSVKWVILGAKCDIEVEST
jgi:hypothetical protein